MSEQETAPEFGPTDLFDIPAYLSALGVPPGPPTLDLLETLHRAHVRSLPFANVDVLLDQHPGVDPEAVQTQLLERRRGGYCFEHAQIFAAAAEHLGFSVQRRLGRVHGPDNSRTHMSVQVELDGRSYLCDPGFGFSVTGPIELTHGATRSEYGRPFTLEQRTDQGHTLWVLTRNGATEHVTDDLPVRPVDVRMGHHFTSTDPQSVFRNHLMVMRHLEDRHVTVTETTVTTRAAGRETERRQTDLAEVMSLVREVGVQLHDHEAKELERVIAGLRAWR